MWNSAIGILILSIAAHYTHLYRIDVDLEASVDEPSLIFHDEHAS